MADDIPVPGNVQIGATMQPQYMGRTMTTYPLSEPEMDHLSMLNAQITIRFSVASFLLALAAGILTNAIFATELTPAGQLATIFVAPLLALFAAGYGVAGVVSGANRKSVWQRIKSGAMPVATVAEARGLLVSGSRPERRD